MASFDLSNAPRAAVTVIISTETAATASSPTALGQRAAAITAGGGFHAGCWEDLQGGQLSTRVNIWPFNARECGICGTTPPSNTVPHFPRRVWPACSLLGCGQVDGVELICHFDTGELCLGSGCLRQPVCMGWIGPTQIIKLVSAPSMHATACDVPSNHCEAVAWSTAPDYLAIRDGSLQHGQVNAGLDYN
ncbi:uncharacterized protein F5Z01DRAFT_633195 [Emericellopsis atlantica]|uniref:Uncharacterized protein n=1 Tax=Emericellopsis atlantica TaxID=2614577 RepID=A0A9P8CSK5_9HYPO|nr:uncharacterized protein F5Z01DRAFT_633195 [Emericellopsis atlantica]KAG9258194.1 hypothetical protein F5Z01DRAFT_633195 [Emericellopsis atlantica]